MEDRVTKTPLVVRIAAWLMLVATAVACAPPLFEVLTAQRGELLPMMFSTQIRVDGFDSKLPYVVFWTVCLAVGVLPAVFALRGSAAAYGIAMVLMGWLAWDVVESIPLNGCPDAFGILLVVIAVLMLSGLPEYFRRICARAAARRDVDQPY